MPHPLEHSYNWQTPALFASIAAVICVVVLVRGRVGGWVPALIVVVALWEHMGHLKKNTKRWLNEHQVPLVHAHSGPVSVLEALRNHFPSLDSQDAERG